MRRASETAAMALILAVLCMDASAQAQDTGWTIRSFDAQYVIHEDGLLRVVERIAVDFDGLQRHGIYRTIPIVPWRLILPDAPGEFSLLVHHVTDGQGSPIPFEVSSNGREIKVGDPDRTVTGARTYVIDYRVVGGIGNFHELDELFWEVTGASWPVPIEHASGNVVLPPARALAFADSTPWAAGCFVGEPGSTSELGCTAEIVSPGTFRFETTTPLAPGHGLTLAAVFPKGLLSGPEGTRREHSQEP